MVITYVCIVLRRLSTRRSNAYLLFIKKIFLIRIQNLHANWILTHELNHLWYARYQLLYKINVAIAY